MSSPTLVSTEKKSAYSDASPPSKGNILPASTPHDEEAHHSEKDRNGRMIVTGDVGVKESGISDREMSWQRTAVLLFTEYIVLAILAFPYSFQVLGMAGGMICTLLIGLITLYTSMTLWRFCLAYPQCRDIADVAYYMFGEKRVYWYAAFVGLALNNIFIMALHCNVGATAINTLNYTICTTYWALILTVIMFAGSLIRDFRHTTIMGIASAGTMFVCFLIVVIGHGVQGTPNGYIDDIETPLTWTVWAPEGTTFVQGMSAMLNIMYTFSGQALLPSFIGDMKRPEDFPKALYICTALEVVLYSLCGAIVYSHTGTIITTAPAYGSLISRYAKPAAIFTLPTIIIVGVLYSLVACRSVFFQIFGETSIHRRKHTVKGWAVWIGIVTAAWIISFIISAVVPFFSDLLSLISSLFNSWFAFIFWAVAYKILYKRTGYFTSVTRSLETVLNVIIFLVGLAILGAGIYSSIASILNSYANSNVRSPFTCANTGFEFTPRP